MPGFVLKLATSDGSMLAKALVDRNPGDNELSPDGATLYVSHYDLPKWTKGVATGNIREGDSSLIAIDTATMAVKWNVTICPAAHGLRLSRDGNTLYATCAPDEIAVVDLTATPIGVRRVSLPGFSEGEGCLRCPYAVSVAPDDSVWVASLGPSSGRDGQGGIDVYDPATGAFDPARKLNMLGRALFPAFVPAATGSGYRVYVPEQQGVAGDFVRVFDVASAGAAGVEAAPIALARGSCQNAHIIDIDAAAARRASCAKATTRGRARWCSSISRPSLYPQRDAGRVSRRHRGGAVIGAPAKKCRRAGRTGRWYTGAMRMQRFVGLAVFPLALVLAGCHEHPPEEGPQADEYVVNCEEADGGFAASDEDFAAVVNAEAAGTVMTTPASQLARADVACGWRDAECGVAADVLVHGDDDSGGPGHVKYGTAMACRAPAATQHKRARRSLDAC